MVIGLALETVGAGLVASMDKLKDTIRETLDFADRAQKASLALGLTFEETKTSLGGSMEGLRGDINQKFAAGIAGMEAGLQGNTAGVARLVNQQMLTGTAYKQTAEAFASLEVGMNLSRDETNVLASNLVETGNKWEISTDKLVGAIEALKSTFPAQKLAGMGKEVMGAVTMLQAELGPQMAGSLNKVMSMVMDTSMEGYARLTKLGITGVRERLSAAKTAAEAQQILKDAFVKASNSFKSVAGDASTGFFKIGIASKIFGANAIEMTTIADQLGQRIGREGEQAADFGMTLANLKKEILVPFQEGLTNMYPFFVKLTDVISGVANIIGQKFKAFADGLGNGAEALKNLQLGIIDFAILGLGKLRSTFAFIGVLISDGVPYILDKVQGAFYELYRDGGIITKLKAVFYRLIATINDFQGMSWLDGADENAAERRAEQNRDFAASMDQLVLDNKNNTYENKKIALALGKGGDTTSPLGMIVKNAAAAQAAALKNDPQVKALNAARQAIVDGNGFARQGNNSLSDAEKNLADINTKTPDLSTGSVFLNETAGILGRSIEEIFGVGKDTTAEEILETLTEANRQRYEAAQLASSPTSKPAITAKPDPFGVY